MLGEARRHRPERDLWWFLTILFATSAIFYATGPLLGSLSGITRADVPAAAMMFICPALAALTVAARTGTLSDVRGRLTTPPSGTALWLFAMLAVSTIVVLASALPGGVGDLSAPGPGVVGLALVFLGAALAEEIGWTAFVLPRLLRLMGEMAAGALVGLVWALWHVIPYAQAGHSTGWILGQCAFTVVFRMLLVHVTARAGMSIWPAVVCHAAQNLAWSLSPNAGADYEPWIAAACSTSLYAVVRASHVASKT